jgi:hypothetical protein
MDDNSTDQKWDEREPPYTVIDSLVVSQMLRHCKPLPQNWRFEGALKEPVWLAVEVEGEACAISES